MRIKKVSSRIMIDGKEHEVVTVMIEDLRLRELVPVKARKEQKEAGKK